MKQSHFYKKNIYNISKNKPTNRSKKKLTLDTYTLKIYSKKILKKKLNI
jgi:hypothetical protein